MHCLGSTIPIPTFCGRLKGQAKLFLMLTGKATNWSLAGELTTRTGSRRSFVCAAELARHAAGVDLAQHRARIEKCRDQSSARMRSTRVLVRRDSDRTKISSFRQEEN